MTLDDLKNRCVLHVLRAWPEATVTSIGAGTISVDGLEIDIRNLLGIVNDSAEKSVDPEADIRQYLEEMLNQKEFDILTRDPSVLKAKLRISIRHPRIFGSLNHEAVVHFPFGNGMVALLVVDLSESTRNVTTRMLEQMKLTPQQAYQLAIENLRTHLLPHNFTSVEFYGKIKVVELTGESYYAASIILLPEVCRKLAQTFKGQFMVAIPCRNRFFAWAIDPKYIIDTMCDFTTKLHKQSTYPITDQLFLVRETGITGLAEMPT